ncbi:MAG: hypothetical protein GWN84_19130 [Gammaproteobacteria bacterium]|nr:hypothetical protein [Gammaproteobacteria bacterium]NIR84941.1 hypothetical protein [Gammaproteobacteria bacterium]NIR91790.1 hypothetical protein [Gammaproteobacteria bacterium]NIU05988.1 hypothetical protein [Gammaproteobacteria bacterium]NIV53035.1 hypothetical protein [Gammaproteobacteria bacterium]
MRIVLKHGSWVIGIAVMAIGGCTLLPEQEAAPATYVLAPATPNETRINNREAEPVLLVTTPQAHAGYASPQMAYTLRPYELSFYSRNEWLDAPSRMLRPILVSVLEQTGHFGAVVTETNAALAQYRLDTEIVRLVHELRSSPHQGRVVLRVQLTDLARRRVLGTRTVSTEEATPENTPYGAVVAINRALARAVDALAAFCVQAIPASSAP